MAKLTYAVSVFTKGVLSLRSVPLGVLRVDSHRLLEDGIRQELVKKVTLALDNGLIFEPKSKVSFYCNVFIVKIFYYKLLLMTCHSRYHCYKNFII